MMALRPLILLMMWTFTGATNMTSSNGVVQHGLINEVYRQNRRNFKRTYFVETWICGKVRNYAIVIYWKNAPPCLGRWTRQSVRRDNYCSSATVDRSAFLGNKEVKADVWTRIFAIALLQRGQVIDFPCIDGTISKFGLGTWTAPYGPAKGLTCHLT
eukprot:6457080-Amphidinium_carterae.1